MLLGAFIRALDYVHATHLRSLLIRQFNEAMRDFDVAVTVSSMDPPARIEDAIKMGRTYPRQARNAFNMIGGLALVLPVGVTQDELPLSMQIVGPGVRRAHRLSHRLRLRAGDRLDSAPSADRVTPAGRRTACSTC